MINPDDIELQAVLTSSDGSTEQITLHKKAFLAGREDALLHLTEAGKEHLKERKNREEFWAFLESQGKREESMTPTASPLWYKAATFPTQDAARQTWKRLYDETRSLNIDLTSFSLIFQEAWCVVAVAEHIPPFYAQAIVNKHLHKGTVISLPDDTVQGLLNRRLERTKHASRTPGSPSLLYEGHAPTPIYLDRETPSTDQDIDKHLDTVTRSLSVQGYPFVEIYKMYHAQAVHSPLFRSLAVHQLEQTEKYIFTETARLMHESVTTGSLEWVNPEQDIWIEHDKAQPYAESGYNVQALYLYRKYPKDRIDTAPLSSEDRAALARSMQWSDDIWGLIVLAENTRPLLTCIYDVQGSVAQIDPVHRCIYGLCKEVTIPDKSGRYHVSQVQECEQCRGMISYFLAWIHTALEQIQLKYAVSPDPEPFKTETLSYTEKKQVPRHHGKGKPKEKAIRVDVPFTVISYDVSVRDLRPVPDENEPERETIGVRVSWLRLHGKADIIYEKRYIGMYSRRFPVRRDGKRREGRVEVTHTEAKYIPLLRPDIRKGTIKRVTARKFQGT